MTPRRRRCATCKKPLPADARSTQKYCDADCRRGKPKPPVQVVPEVQLGAVAEATEKAIAAATTAKVLTSQDLGAVEALRFLARKIDTEDELRTAALEWAAKDEKRKPPPIDNVSIPTYLKYCESLGLTPGGRARVAGKKEGEGATGGSKLSGLRSVPKPTR